MAEMAEGALEGMNDSGTCTAVDPKLTQGCSWFGRNSFPLETRAALHHLRVQVSATSSTGLVISTLLEQLENRPTYARPSWAKDRRQTLDFQIEKSLARLGG